MTNAKLGSNKTHGLCFIDLDRFKAVNDTCGHAAGDELLRQLATRLTENLRGTDVLARLGGNEFGLILAHISPEQAVETAERMCRAVGEFHLHWHDKVFQVGSSIGLATVDATAQSADELIRQADAACYRAKRPAFPRTLANRNRRCVK